jgi:carbon-monoxide dehydrogenase medium subunit
VKPAPFDYHGPRSLDEALALLARYGTDAKPLAGGQSLIPAMNFRLSRPAVLVDLNGIEELAYVRASGGGVAIGAMTRQSVAERDESIARLAPLLRETMPFVAHPQIRNRGTIGGSLAHADPAAELPAVMVALDATFEVRGPNGARTVPSAAFNTGLFTTAIKPGELLTGVTIPAAPANSGWAFEEVARRHGDFALAGVAVRVTLDAKGKCSDVRIAVVSVGDGPELARKAAKGIAEAAELAGAKDIDPPGDIHASAGYRRRLTTVLTRRALTRAFARAAERVAERAADQREDPTH